MDQNIDFNTTSIPEDVVFKSPAFRKWKKRIISHGNKIEKIDVKAVITRSGGRFRSAFIDCLLLTPEGHRISRCVLLKGECVVIVPLLFCEGETYTVLVKQRRIVDGNFSLEFPSGGMDASDDILATAVEELKQETGIEADSKDLIPLSAEPFKVCESSFDELAYFFCVRKEVSTADLETLHGATTGNHADGEYTVVQVLILREAKKVASFQVATGLLLLGDLLKGKGYGSNW